MEFKYLQFANPRKARIIFLTLLFVVSALTQLNAQKNKKAQKKSNLPAVSLSDVQNNHQTDFLNVDEYLKSLVTSKKLNTADAQYIITSQHISRTSGTKHIYFNQAIGGLMVYGTESDLHIGSDGTTIKAYNTFVKDIAAQLVISSGNISAAQAINSVAQQMGYAVFDLQEIERKGTPNQEVLFNKAGISITDIPVKLMYYYREGYGVTLVWELSVEEIDSSDWWNFRINANTGTIIDKDNYTVSCFIEDPDYESDDPNVNIVEDKLFYTVENEPSFLVGSYNVIPMPIESPNHGSRAVIANPDNATASPFGWHDTNGVAGAESQYTIGNNADAYDDRTSTTSGTGSGTNSERAFGGPTLTFSDTFNPNVTLNGGSIDAAVTNLFYWSNIIHDVTYQYGFDEASGNFQFNNYGNGGISGDWIRAEAQDGSGTCNANFSTPPDGGRGRMQMYVCNTRDGDFDNGVIAHEYGHGISIRLTGGAGNTGCLNNTEQMGEGWSDYYALMLSLESGDAGTDSRGIGTWLVGQGAGGPGIRTYPYSTNFAVNPHTYDDIKTEVIPHGIGSVWCAMIWEMTWELINDHGFSTDFYTFTGNVNVDSGNVQALALVTEGLKLQPCSPGFIDGRDAILAADVAIYGGANQCAIWDAFARRGLGFSATQGSTGSRSDGVEAFDLPPGTGSFASSLSSVCITEGVQTGLSGGSPTGGVYSGVGVTDDGNGTTFTFDPNIAGVGNATVTYSVTDACSGGGSSNYNDIINVTSGIPALVCQNTTITLDGGGNATITWPDVVSNFIPGGYVLVSTGGNSIETFTGGATSLNLGDDIGSAAIGLPFSFEFYSTPYSQFYVASNGFISFDGNGMT